MKANIFTLLMIVSFIGLTTKSNGQCTASISASPEIASCGNSTINFDVGYTVATTFDFNTGVLPSGWQSSPYTVGSPCYTKTPDNSPYFWATKRAYDGRRWVITKGVNVSAGGNIVFDMRFGSDDPSYNCEDPDYTNEGVYLQFSNNGGPWYNIKNWVPNGYKSGPLYQWNTYTLAIPSGAVGPNTRFRWFQPSNSGDSWDNWGLDDITIQAGIGGIASYSWNFGDGNTSTVAAPSHTYATPGIYTVTLTLNFYTGCIATSQKTVEVVDDLSLTAVAYDADCFGAATGHIDLNIEGGKTPFTINWSNGSHNEDIGSLTAGTYSVTVTDATGCSTTTSATVEQPTQLALSTATTDYTCAGDNSGEIDLTITGGTLDYSIAWSNGETSEDISGLEAGTYNVSVTDGNGCNITGSASIYQIDAISPTVTVQDATLELDASGNATLEVSDVVSAYSDNCAMESIIVSPTSFSCNELGTNVVTITATDVNGNVTETQAQVTVQDNIAPTLSCPANIVAYTDPGICGTTVDFAATATDNCSYTIDYQPQSGTFFSSGLTTVTVTATDPSGNATQCSFTVEIIDNELPVITCPFDIVVNADQDVCGAVVTYGQPTATDNCGTGVLPTSLADHTYMGTFRGHTYFLSTGQYSPEQAHARAIAAGGHLATISDAAENAFISGLHPDRIWIGMTDRDQEGNWKWINSEPVTYTNWSPGEPNNAGGNEDWAVINWAAGGTWNDWYYTQPAYYVIEFDGGTLPTQLVSGLASGSVFPIGTTEVTYSVTDTGGNTVECSFSVTVNDNQAPTLQTQNIEVILTANGTVEITASDVATASDNCDVSVVLSQYLFDADDAFNSPVTIIATATDESGNQVSAPVQVTVIDPVPVALCKDIILQLDASGSASISATDVDNGSYSVVGIGNWSVAPSNFDCNNIGGNTVTLTVTSTLGKSASCTATVTVVDNIAPNAVAKNITVQLDASGSANIVPVDIDNGSTDNCTIASLDFLGAGTSGGDNGGQETTPVLSGTRNGRMLTSITYNYQGDVRTLIPSEAIPSKLVLSSLTAGSGDANRFWDATSTTMSESEALSVLGDFDLGTAFQDCADPAGVKHDVMFDSPITPGEGPEIFIVHGGLRYDYQILDTDGNVVYTIPQNLGSSVVIGGSNYSTGFYGFYLRNNVNFAVQQIGRHGNSQRYVLAIDVNQADVSEIGGIRFGGGSCNYTYEILGLQPDVSSTQQIDFACENVGVNPVTLQVTDASGNVSTASALVNVEDNVAPVVLTQNITVELDENGAATISTDDIDAGSSDACGIETLSLDVTSFDCSNVAATSTETQVINTDGSWLKSSYVDYNSYTGTYWPGTSSVPAPGTFTISPTIYAYSVTVIPGTQGLFTTNDVTFFRKTFNLADASNVKATLLASVDNSVQIFINGVAVALEGHADGSNFSGAQFHRLVLDENGSNTNGGAGYDSFDQFTSATPSTLFVNGTNEIILAVRNYNGGDRGAVTFQATIESEVTTSNTVTLTAIDVNGNSASATATVTVLDVTAPVVLTRDITVQLDDSGAAYISVADIDAGSSDACGIDILSLDITAFSCADVGTNTVTLTAVDVNGNSASATATVTVEDNVAPVVLTQDITVQLDDSGNASIIPEMIDAGSTDACGIASLSLDVTAFDCSNVGENTVTLTAVDVNGNSASATAVVMVEDNVAPVVVTQDVVINLDDTGNGQTSATLVDNGSSDACGIASMVLSQTDFDCSHVGENTVTLTVTDVNGNVASAEATVTVYDITPPVVVTQDVTVYLDAAGNASITTGDIDAGSTDACGIASYELDVYDFNCDDVYEENTVTLTVTDVNGNVASATALVTVVNDLPEINEIIVTDVTNIADAVSIQASYTDVNLASVTFDWGNGEVTSGTVDTDAGVVAGEYVYAETGLYDVTVTITDVCGETATETYSYVVIYDPCAGHVTGGGYFQPDKKKNNFGYNAKYDKDTGNPKGNVNFHNKDLGLHVKADTAFWLMVNTDQAIFHGPARVNDVEGFFYIVSMIDGDVVQKHDEDFFRIIVWDEFDNIVYDNQPGEEDRARATELIDFGSLVIHKGCNEEEVAEETSTEEDTTTATTNNGKGKGKGKSNAYGNTTVTLYPNPVDRKLNLNFTNIEDQQLYYDIVDFTGRAYIKNVNTEIQGSVIELDVSDLNLKQGNYMIILRNEDNSFNSSKNFLKK